MVRLNEIVITVVIEQQLGPFMVIRISLDWNSAWAIDKVIVNVHFHYYTSNAYFFNGKRSYSISQEMLYLSFTSLAITLPVTI